MTTIELVQVSKKFGTLEVIPPLDLKIETGEFVVFVGPSGSGKTTLLRIIAGLETASSGQILLGGKDVIKLPSAKREMAMVFQSYALYPHLTVGQNIGFPLKMAGVARAEREARVIKIAETLNLSPYLDRRPSALSGGQRQRVAIGRAIIREPRAFLFDEPLSNLDAALRATMRLEIMELHHKFNATMIFVTHDQVEAMTMADRIVILNQGRIEQTGSPMELFTHPVNQFVAGFLGLPRMNFIGGEFAKSYGVKTIGIRPESIALSSGPAAIDHPKFSVEVGVIERLGADSFAHISDSSLGKMTMRLEGDSPIRYGDRIMIELNPEQFYRFNAEGLTIGSPIIRPITSVHEGVVTTINNKKRKRL
ncbi:MAG: ABC transporter ATP-binding protein [Candidatus Pacebacteria bacterium]|nr:ABC transporter ATP-binding protein [Candidatus Paceibacterota bacterium]